MARNWTKPTSIIGILAFIASLVIIIITAARVGAEELNQVANPTPVTISAPQQSAGSWKWNSKPIERRTAQGGGTQHADVLVISVRNNEVEITNNSNVSGTMQIMSTDLFGDKEAFPVPIKPFSQIGGTHDNGLTQITLMYEGRTLFEASVNPRNLCLNMEFKATIKHGPYPEYNSPLKKGRSAKLSWTNMSFIPLVEHYSYNYLYYNVYGQPLLDGYKGDSASGIPIERGEDDSRTARSVSVMLNIDDSTDERTSCATATLHDLWNEVPSASLNPTPVVVTSPAKGR